MTPAINTAAAAIPTNEEMSSFLTEDASHVEAVEEILDRSIRAADAHERRAAETSKHIGGDPLKHPREAKDIAKKALRDVAAYVNPSYEVKDPPVLLATETFVLQASQIGLWQLVLSGAAIGGINLATDLPPHGNLVLSAISVGIYLKRLVSLARMVLQAPAYYDGLFHRITTREFQSHALRSVIFHEGTHGIQTQNPQWDKAKMRGESSIEAFIEGQAINVQHHLGTTVDPDDHGLIYYTLRDEIDMLTYAYAMLCRAHNRTSKETLVDDHFIQEAWQHEQEAWSRNPQHIIGAAAFAIARHKRTLPPHREILDGNFGFVRG
jgi:hypothetical protein